MEEDRNSYRSITKSIGLFGGTKVFQILVNLIKNKVVAVLLGPLGMGIQGMIQSTIQMVSSLTGFGLHTSAVRDVAQAHSSGDVNRIDTTVTILRKLVLLTGLLGTIIVFVFSKQFSILAFHNEEWSLEFKIVSIVLFFDQLVIGQNVLLQGTFHYKYLAASSLISSIAGLIVSIPVYYFFHTEGIVPAMILTSLFHLIVTSYYANRIKYTKIHLDKQQLWNGGKAMIILGIAIAMAGVVNTGKTYLVRTFLSTIGSLEVVGLYTAGIGIANQYIDVVLQAMGSDYSPRLAAIADNQPKFIETINRQALLLITLVAPLIIIFVVFAKYLVLLLFSSKFLPIIGMIEWIMFGMLFRTLSWSISYSFVARGEARAFFANELIAGFYSIPLTVLGYKYYSFEGVGIAFCLTYLLYTIQVYIISKRLFSFKFSRDVKKICFPIIALCLCLVIILKLIHVEWLKLSIGFGFIVIIAVISYYLLNNMIDIKSLISSVKSRIINK